MNAKEKLGLATIIIICAFAIVALYLEVSDVVEGPQKYYVAQIGNSIEVCPEPASSHECVILEVV